MSTFPVLSTDWSPRMVLTWSIPDLDEEVTCPDGRKCWEVVSWSTPPQYNQACSSMIIHLNDHHRWDRGQIADWLDTLDLDLSFQT